MDRSVVPLLQHIAALHLPCPRVGGPRLAAAGVLQIPAGLVFKNSWENQFVAERRLLLLLLLLLVVARSATTTTRPTL